MTHDDFLREEAVRAMARTRVRYAGHGAMASLAPVWAVRRCKSYREVCRLAWDLRAVQGMTRASLAEACALPASRISEYLNRDDAPNPRDMPAYHIAAFQRALGNSAIVQWLVYRSGLTLVEEVTWLVDCGLEAPALVDC